MHLKPTARHRAAQAVCLGSATLAAAYYAAWAPPGPWYWPCLILLGAGAFALDLVKPQLFMAGSREARAGRLGRAWAARAIGLLIAAVSMISVDGMMLKLRSDTADGKGHTIGSYDRDEAAFKKAVAEIAQLGTIEPKAALEARLQASVPIDVWRLTKQCTDVSRPASREACKPAFAIREEIGKAERLVELEAKRDAAKQKLDTTTRPSSADPQIDAMAKVFGFTTAGIMLGLTWLAGLALELVACCGPMLLADPRDEEPADANLTAEEQALQWVYAEMARKGGRLEIMNSILASRFGVDAATVTRWRQRWIERGVFEESKKGRTIVIRIAGRR